MTPYDDSGRRGIFKRLLIGAALVIFASAGATSVAAFHEVDRVVSALKLRPELKLGGELATTDPGAPQTIMILGSDRRPRKNREGAYGARSDTIILVRLDPSKEATAIMSLPRDLKVQIPGHRVDKINAAYEIGGPKLTLETVKRFTGLSINHVINVDFRGFWAAVNAVGCVYADIDRRYFNNTPGFAYINIQPGYQRMCGRKALQYVRYRHEDNDLVRSARQQDFLRQAKQQIATGKLIHDRDKLIKIFGKYTSTDGALRSRSEVIRLLKLAVFSADQPVREIHFAGTVGPSYVTTTSAKVQRLVKKFLGVQASRGPRGTLGPRRKRAGRALGLERADAAGKDQAIQAVRAGAGGRLPVYYPTLRTKNSLYAGPPRVYRIRGPGGHRYRAYRMVIKKGLVGEYYGLQATTWDDPPIMRNPDERRTIKGRTYELFYDGDRLRLVGWRTKKAVYWISNTLLLTLTKRQMLAIAKSSRRL